MTHYMAQLCSLTSPFPAKHLQVRDFGTFHKGQSQDFRGGELIDHLPSAQQPWLEMVKYKSAHGEWNLVLLHDFWYLVALKSLV